MTRPIFEPTPEKQAASSGFNIEQLLRRPVVGLATAVTVLGDTGSFAAGNAYATDFAISTFSEDVYGEHQYGLLIRESGLFLVFVRCQMYNNTGFAPTGAAYIRGWIMEDETKTPLDGLPDVYYHGPYHFLPKRFFNSPTDVFVNIGLVPILLGGTYPFGLIGVEMAHGHGSNRQWAECSIFAIRVDASGGGMYFVSQNADYPISDLYDVS